MAIVLRIHTVAINPWKWRQSREYFEKKDERKTAGVRNGQIHLIHLHGSDFIQEMGFSVSGRFSSILVIPSFLVISIFLTPPAPPFTWMNYCVLIWGCLFPVTEEKHSGEQKRGWLWASSCVSARIVMSITAGGLFVPQSNAECYQESWWKRGASSPE